MTCAARSITKPSYSQFSQKVHRHTPPHLAEQMKRLPRHYRGSVDRTTEKFFKQTFAPRDIVCIADEATTQQEIADSGVLDTFSGTTILLAPVEVAARGSEFGNSKSNVLVLFAGAVASHKLGSPCDKFVNNDIRTPEPDHSPRDLLNKCNDEQWRKRVALLKDLLGKSDRPVPGVKNTLVTYRYEAEQHKWRENQELFGALVAAVLVLEELNSPFYEGRRGTVERPEVPEFRVYDPLTGAARSSTSLLGFLGDEIHKDLVDHMFRRHASLVSKFVVEPGGVKVVSVRELEDVSPWKFPLRRPVSQMMRAYVCSEIEEGSVREAMFGSRVLIDAGRDALCPRWGVGEKEVWDLTEWLFNPFDRGQLVGEITALDTRDVIDVRLKELKEIQLRQLTTLIGVEGYLANLSFGAEIEGAKAELERLEAERANPVGALGAMVDVVVSASGGYAGVGSFFGGLEAAKKLYDDMPKGGFGTAKQYYWQNRAEFKTATEQVRTGGQAMLDGVRRGGAALGFLQGKRGFGAGGAA